MATATGARPRVRLPREEREQLIIEEAIRFFAEVGLSGDTKAFAGRMGVAQPLIYRYFENKEALIARVFDETFLKNWNPLWEQMLTDTTQSIPERLLTFHRDFARVQLTRNRVRLSLFFALGGWDMNSYFKLMRQHVYIPIAIGLRQYAGAPSIKKQSLRDLEVEIAKSVVEKIQYYGIRKWVYEVPTLPPIDSIIELSVSTLLEGTRSALPEFEGRGNLYRYANKT
jgi:AcrR family transcriptional regulator